MTPEERQAARARCEAATPGPWEKYDQNDGMEMVFGALWCIANDAYMNPPDEDSDDPWEAVDIMIATGIEADADFIAAARTDLPAALDALDAKDAEIERLRKLLLRWLQVPMFDPATFDETMDALRGEGQ